MAVQDPWCPQAEGSGVTRRIVTIIATVVAVCVFAYMYDAALVGEHQARCNHPALMEPSC